MGDLKTENTSYPASLDTATTIADATDTAIAAHQNGPNSAILAIETELGVTPSGSLADVATRLAVQLHADGGMLRGTSFPASPANKPHLFYRSDEEKVYVYNTVTASYDVIANIAVLAPYMRNDTATTVTVQHTFNPSVAGAPFLLGANASGQKVVGLNADTVDGRNPGSASGVATLDGSSKVVENPANATATPTASKIPIADGSGKLVAGWGGSASTLATLDGSAKVVENPANATATPTASKIPIADGSGKLAAGWGGSASTLATLDGSSKVVENPASATVTPTPGKIPIANGTGQLAAGWGGAASTLATLNGSSIVVEPAYRFMETSGNLVLKMKILNIGAWVMTSTPAVTITHGLDIANIITASATIINDGTTGKFPIDYSFAGTEVCGQIDVGTSDIYLARFAGSYFDSTDFDAGSPFNRGYIIIWYLE